MQAGAEHINVIADRSVLRTLTIPFRTYVRKYLRGGIAPVLSAFMADMAKMYRKQRV